MEHKVLIADDSLTIQKVIKITLANEPFELLECVDAANLIKMVQSANPAMVLLDFNLSENKTGYDLCREIKSVNPDIGVLMLFGTFDTVDEGLLNDCGCNYRIVKPFDGTKFINLCRALASDFESSQQNQPEGDADFSIEDVEDVEESEQDIDEQDIPGEIEEEDEWVVNQPRVDDEEESEVEEHQPATAKADHNKLELEVEDWGMEIPSVIGDEKGESSIEVPGIIEAVESSSSNVDAYQEEGNVLPESDDLEYPDMASAPESEPESVEAPKSKLIPLDELSDSDEFFLDQDMGVSHGGTDTEEGVRNLEDQIKDELEDSEDEEESLWAADIVEEEAPETGASQESGDDADEEFKAFDSDSVDTVEIEDLSPLQPHKLTEVGAPSDFPEDVMAENSAPTSNPAALSKEEVARMRETLKQEIKAELRTELKTEMKEELREELRGTLKDEVAQEFKETKEELEQDIAQRLSPLVEAFVKKYSKDQVDKISWEVIPDLAENIIKKEIQKISDSIMD